MGRHPKGLKLVWRDGYGIARFTWAKRRHFISTGETDPARAQAKAEQIYAEVVSGRRRKVSAAVRVLQPLDEIFAVWLSTLEGVLDVETIRTYRVTYVAAHFLPFFRTFDRIVDESNINAYAIARLRKVMRKTMQKELGCLRQFLRWCKMEGFLDTLPVWPELPRTAKGKRSGRQREKANELSEADVLLAIRSLPVLSDRITKRKDRRRFVVQDRFIVAYETGLRPATLDAIRLHDHWVRGAKTLRIEDQHDKARFGREVPLTDVAVAALERAVDVQGLERGPIFGRHDYRTYLRRTGIAKLAAYDFRHARATHLLERGASLNGVAFLHGHTQTTTTAKYTHPTRRAGDRASGFGGALDPKPE